MYHSYFLGMVTSVFVYIKKSKVLENQFQFNNMKHEACVMERQVLTHLKSQVETSLDTLQF